MLVWFIDSNVLAHWIMGEGSVLQLLVDKFNLTQEFATIYSDRYRDSIDFVNKVLHDDNRKNQNEFYISSLGINELFSAVRDEFRSMLLFKNGMPISRWRDSRNIPEIKEGDYREIYEKIMLTFDQLFAENRVFPIAEKSLEDDPNYLDIFSSLLFLIKDAKTQDATLLTTAILNKANYFVSRDEPLIKAARSVIMDKYGLKLIKPATGFQVLKRLTK
ncbi:MAG: hypothetical protein AB1507_02575 [Bacillota bacterium]|jgi:hypothetical protein